MEWWGKEGFGEQVLDRHFSRSQKLFLKFFLPNFSKTCNTKKKQKKKFLVLFIFIFYTFTSGRWETWDTLKKKPTSCIIRLDILEPHLYV